MTAIIFARPRHSERKLRYNCSIENASARVGTAGGTSHLQPTEGCKMTDSHSTATPPELPPHFQKKALLPQHVTGQDMAQVVAVFLHETQGRIVDPDAIWHSSPTGELFQVYFAFYQACAYFGFCTHLILPEKASFQDIAVVPDKDWNTMFYWYDGSEWRSDV